MAVKVTKDRSSNIFLLIKISSQVWRGEFKGGEEENKCDVRRGREGQDRHHRGEKFYGQPHHISHGILR